MNDFLLDTDLNMVVANGDLAVGVANEQHMELLLVTQKGAWKENPLVGVGLDNYLLDNDVSGMLAEVRAQWQNDGVILERLFFDEVNKKIEFDGNYPN
jgi:hypothetical protein